MKPIDEILISMNGLYFFDATHRRDRHHVEGHEAILIMTPADFSRPF